MTSTPDHRRGVRIAARLSAAAPMALALASLSGPLPAAGSVPTIGTSTEAMHTGGDSGLVTTTWVAASNRMKYPDAAGD